MAVIAWLTIERHSQPLNRPLRPDLQPTGRFHENARYHSAQSLSTGIPSCGNPVLFWAIADFRSAAHLPGSIRLRRTPAVNLEQREYRQIRKRPQSLEAAFDKRLSLSQQNLKRARPNT